MGAMAAVSTYLPVGVCRQLLQGRRVYDAELHLGQSDTNCTQSTFRPRLRPYIAYMIMIVIVMIMFWIDKMTVMMMDSQHDSLHGSVNYLM